MTTTRSQSAAEQRVALTAQDGTSRPPTTEASRPSPVEASQPSPNEVSRPPTAPTQAGVSSQPPPFQTMVDDIPLVPQVQPVLQPALQPDEWRNFMAVFQTQAQMLTELLAEKRQREQADRLEAERAHQQRPQTSHNERSQHQHFAADNQNYGAMIPHLNRLSGAHENPVLPPHPLSDHNIIANPDREHSWHSGLPHPGLPQRSPH